MSLKTVDLFAGAGGLSLGFEMVGISSAYALEEDKWAAETFAANFPNCRVDVRDIRSIGDREIRSRVGVSPAVLIGGPPCQGFSHSNTASRDPRDPRNTLFQDYIRFLKALQPDACVIENVTGLVSARNEVGQEVLPIILDGLAAVGYEAKSFILDAADYGVPQHRERLFIVGTRRDLQLRYDPPAPTHVKPTMTNLSLFGKNQTQYVTLWDAISDLPQVVHPANLQELEYSTPPSNAYQALMRLNAAEITNHEPMRHTARLVERFASIRYGESEASLPDELAPRKRGEPAALSGKRYGQNSRRQHPDLPCNTIPASSHTNFLHPYLDRNFTVRELARIQSFPDWFVFKGKRAVLSRSLSIKKGLLADAYLDQRSQIGNAVPPLLAKAIADSILEAFSRKRARRAS